MNGRAVGRRRVLALTGGLVAVLAVWNNLVVRGFPATPGTYVVPTWLLPRDAVRSAMGRADLGRARARSGQRARRAQVGRGLRGAGGGGIRGRRRRSRATPAAHRCADRDMDGGAESRTRRSCTSRWAPSCGRSSPSAGCCWPRGPPALAAGGRRLRRPPSSGSGTSARRSSALAANDLAGGPHRHRRRGAAGLPGDGRGRGRCSPGSACAAAACSRRCCSTWRPTRWASLAADAAVRLCVSRRQPPSSDVAAAGRPSASSSPAAGGLGPGVDVLGRVDVPVAVGHVGGERQVRRDLPEGDERDPPHRVDDVVPRASSSQSGRAYSSCGLHTTMGSEACRR